ncbi:monovalent cation/H+ antiporter subunit D [Tianweitania sp. BSSL-BM11]|uniref:Monovalent cation/H+ antiporter subunit D n=1 Tax=Tianweitania aestuarii TaxID=2814886 RepID=A0ABS5S364_9HYPH|nr:monovalent cation/H+ antiporter subunit D [Tianweitania aestuarii]MBS9722367.1 monovalent cation/H+ antiporter subunit D [Tianweitania aestuarii]
MEWRSHLLIVPILLPLLTGALLLLFDERRHVLKATLSFVATVILLVVGLVLMRFADSGEPDAARTGVYLLGNWSAPFGIVLVLDRLSALMLVLTGTLALASLTFSLARWDRIGPHYHTLFQFLLMGLNGAFLTGDLFNLFVFFEVLLAASYGLVLHGTGIQRVRAGLHYIAINLAASLLFLVGVSLIYGVTGTLNMADLAVRIPAVTPGDQPLLLAGAAVLGVAFLVKAGIYPLGFWLPTAYTAAAAPVAGIFAILSKVGIYILFRLSLLLFGVDAGASAGFGEFWLFGAGIATVAFASAGVLASQGMARLAGFYVLVSSGTLLSAIGLSTVEVTSGALYYMVSSTMALSAFFLLVELLDRAQDPAADVLAVTMEAYGDDPDMEDVVEDAGLLIPGTIAILGLCFVACAILLAGLPPLSGFIGKFAMLDAIIGSNKPTLDISMFGWLFTAALIGSGLAAMVAMVRAGIRTFWAPIEGTIPRIKLVEIMPVAGLLLLCAAMTIGGGPVLRYMDATARAMHAPHVYVEEVLSASPVPPPATTEGSQP